MLQKISHHIERSLLPQSGGRAASLESQSATERNAASSRQRLIRFRAGQKLPLWRSRRGLHPYVPRISRNRRLQAHEPYTVTVGAFIWQTWTFALAGTGEPWSCRSRSGRRSTRAPPTPQYRLARKARQPGSSRGPISVTENAFWQTQSLRLPISSSNVPTQHRWVVPGMTPFDRASFLWKFQQLSKMLVRGGQATAARA